MSTRVHIPTWALSPDTTSYGSSGPGLASGHIMGSPLLRVRGQQGMRAATRMTLARALQLVSTCFGPWAAGTRVPALVRTALPQLEGIPSRDAALFLMALSQVYGRGEIVSIPAWRVASRIGSWKTVIVGMNRKLRR